MKFIRRLLLAVVGLIVAAIAFLLVGLRIKPEPFPAYPEETPDFDTVSLPEGLPEPVEAFYRELFGEEIPVITSAVITGEAQLRFNGITFPSRLRFTHEAGQNYRHYIEATVWGYPLLRVNERYLDQVGRMELPFGIIENEPKINQAANLGLWGESIWLTPLFLTDERVRWEAIDETSARLIVPFEDGEDSFTVYFDSETNLLTGMEAMRWKEADSAEKTRWILRVEDGWEEFHGIPVPVKGTVTWEDDGRPWLVFTNTDIAYNVDIAEYIRARGL